MNAESSASATAVAWGQLGGPPQASSRRRLWVFSPLPPQRNGLADYLLHYLRALAEDFEVKLVAETGRCDETREAMARLAPWFPGASVLDEAHFLAAQPEPAAQILYNLGNNADCAYMLDYVHRFPGAQIVHDISLFYLHQVAAHSARADGLLPIWLKQDGYVIPDDFLSHQGLLTRTPGELYQECLMLKRLTDSAQGVMVHTAYAERRLLAAAMPGLAAAIPLARIPHFVLPLPELDAALVAEVLGRHEVETDDFLMLVPGFLTGNKMLYEVMAALAQVQAQCPRARLLFAGEERPQEYAVSQRLAQLWPGQRWPKVTGYLEADELDVLLQRADLSFLLRYPSYGESSGLLPRAVMGGGRVLTVDIGAYPEFRSPHVTAVPTGAAAVPALARGILAAYADWQKEAPTDRQARSASEALRLRDQAPDLLYRALRAWLDQSWRAPA